MKFVLGIEASLVFIGSISGLPLENPLYSPSFVEFAIKFIVLSKFLPQAVIGVALKASRIGDGL
jgi:hypothetical protein